jgi:hypothetical protein
MPKTHVHPARLSRPGSLRPAPRTAANGDRHDQRSTGRGWASELAAAGHVGQHAGETDLPGGPGSNPASWVNIAGRAV